MSNSALSLPDVSHLGPEDAKEVLRPVIREHRAKRTRNERAKLEESWASTVLDFIGDREFVACYVARDAEPPTNAVIEAIANAGKQVILPKLGPGLSRAWGYFRGVDDLTQMAPGRPGEPSGPAFDNDILANVDTLIIPALAVSRSGARLGQGGGWYDRALKVVSPEAKVGAMIFPEEYVSIEIPQDGMDVPVPYVIFPEEIVETRHNGF